MQEKQRCMILFFSLFKAFLISSAGSLLASKKSKNIYCGKNAAIIRRPPRGVTALQVVEWFLGPRPLLFSPPPTEMNLLSLNQLYVISFVI